MISETWRDEKVFLAANFGIIFFKMSATLV